MKKLLSILFLFISIATFSQTKLTAPVVRNIPADTSYPTHIDSLGKGGWIAFSDIASRDALPFSSRKIGMVATVDADVYMLLGGYGNVNWSRVYFSAIGTVDSIIAPYPYSQYIAWSNASQLFSFPTFLKKVYGEGNIVVDSTGVDSIRIRCINCGTVQNGRISGLIVSYDTLYRYDITAGIGVINQAQYTSVQSSVTLQPADVSFDRIDVIADSLGTIVVKTGVAAASPQEPQIDPATEIALTFVTVYANTTAPPGVTVTPIYDEQFPAEWGTSVTSGLTVNFANTVTSFHLLKAADVGTWATTKLITFTSPTTINRNDISLLKMYINLKAPLVSTANIQAYFYNGTTVVGLVTLTAAQGFSKTVTGYQNITVPLSSLAFTGTNFNKVAIRFTGVGSGIYLDYVQLQGGVPQPTTGGITGLYRKLGVDSIFWKDANGNEQAILDSLGAGGGVSGISKLGNSPFGLTKPNDSTYTVDSSVIATRTRLVNELALKLNNSDTSAMLAPYQSAINTNTVNITLKLNKTDSVSGVANNYVTQYQRKKTSDSLLALINTKLNITDTTFLHGRAVQSFAINGTGDSAILLLYGGVRYAVKVGGTGSTPTYQQVLTSGSTLTGSNTINNGGFIQKSSNGKNQFDSIGIIPSVYIADSIWHSGTSITVGTGASSVGNSFPILTDNKLGALPSVHGCSGCQMVVEGINSTNLGLIPSYSSTKYRWMILEWGINDMGLGITDTATFAAAYLRYLDTAIARGWPVAKILVLSPSYEDSTVSVAATMARQNSFNICTQSIAARRSTLYLNIWGIELSNGKQLLLVDGIHPSDYGVSVGYVNPITNKLTDSVRAQGQQVAINGLSEFQKIKFEGTDTATYKSIPLMFDSSGNIVRATKNTFLLNGLLSPQAQPFVINTTATANIANTLSANFLRVAGAIPSGMTGASLELAYSGGVGYVYPYDRTGGLTKPLVLNPFGGQVVIGTTATAGAELLSLTGGVKQAWGQFTNGVGATTGSGVEIGTFNGGGYIGGYNRGGGAALDLYLQILGGKGIFGATSGTGSNLWQFTGNLNATKIFAGGFTTPTAKFHLGNGTDVAASAPLKFTYTSLATTAASGTGTVATITFSAQALPPFPVNSQIIIAGVTPSGYNGTYTVASCSTTQVTFLSSTTGSQTVAGTVSQNSLLTTPEAGAVEYDGTDYYGTDATSRKKFVRAVSGSNGSIGTATLVGGTVTVSTTYVTSGSKIFLTDATTGVLTNIGTPTVGTITAGTSFVINSSNVLDTSNINWFIINP